MTGYVHPQLHKRIVEDRESKLVEACNEIAFWKTAAQRALEIMTARENVQEELRRRTLEACRLGKRQVARLCLAGEPVVFHENDPWYFFDKLEKELQLEEGPCEAPGNT